MKTALLIDDDSVSRKDFVQLLSSSEWNVIEACDEATGLALGAANKPDLVVCDLSILRRHGRFAGLEIRQQPERYGRPIIIVTAQSALAADRQAVLNAGADLFLLKPVQANDFLNAVNSFEFTTAEEQISTFPGDGEGGFASIDGFFVKFWGVRGSIPVPGPTTLKYGGNTSCVEIRADGELIILDAGTGIRNLGLSLAEEFKDQPLRFTLLISHTHWDHIQGFPFFAPAYNPANSIRIMSFERSNNDLLSTLSNQMESPYFPITMEKMPGNLHVRELKDMNFKVGRVEAKAMFSNHPGCCAGYRFNTSRGSIAYVPDNELVGGESAERRTREGRQFPCRGDDDFVDFLQGCDVLVMDSQYGPAEYSRHMGWGHSCWEDSVRVAAMANVKKLFLHHHDPGHEDDFLSEKAEQARALAKRLGSSMEVDCAREGVTVPLNFRSPAGY